MSNDHRLGQDVRKMDASFVNLDKFLELGSASSEEEILIIGFKSIINKKCQTTTKPCEKTL